MAISLKHTTQAVGTDAGNGEIRKAEWNEEHTLSLATGKLLGRTTAATGAVEEITPSTGLTLSAGSLAVSTIPVANGGTNITSYTIGDLIAASASGVLSRIADIATGNALLSGGVNVLPAYGKVTLTGHISGVLPVANGGTGVTTSTGTVSVVLSDSPALTGNVTVATNSATAAVTINQTGAGNAFVVEDSTSPDATPFVIDASGNVGIGTATASYKLTVQSSSSGSTGFNRDIVSRKGDQTNFYRTSIVSNDSASASGAFGAFASGIYHELGGGFAASGGLTFATNTANAGPITFATADTEAMRITAIGNVGIGTTTPTTPLSVSGDTSLGGVVYRAQPTQTSKAAAATLTIAELLTGIIQYTGAVATLTLPTGTLIEGGLPATFPTNMSFDVSFINTGAALLTIGTAASLTLVGTMTVATVTSATFRFRKTALNTYTVYRIS